MTVAGRPWMMFYPAAWRADPLLRVCSLAARGLWIEMLFLMYEAEPRGSLLVAGKQVSDAQLAALVGAPKKPVSSLIAELEQASVFSRDEDGTIYSRRMRRDVLKAGEDKRNGKLGGNPNLKRGVNPGPKAKKIEDRNQNLKSSLQEDARDARVAREAVFDRFWASFPIKTHKGGVKRELNRILDAGEASPEELIVGAELYARAVAGKDRKHIASPKYWLHDTRWKDDYGDAAQPALPIIRRDSDEGRAWDAYSKAIKGKPMFWTNGRATVETRFPPDLPPPDEPRSEGADRLN